MSMKESIVSAIENITSNLYASSASMFFWGEVEAPDSLRRKVSETLEENKQNS